jgi:flavin-dependent dehydrogenase
MTSVRSFDVLISGSGPAGCAAALKLAGARSVLLVDRVARFPPTIGESLHPDGRRLLADLGVLQVMNKDNHAPYHANRSIWGSDRPIESDFIRHPDGPGWHIERQIFNQRLRDAATAQGASLLAGVRITELAHDDGEWRVTLTTRSGDRCALSAKIVVDAGGRRAPLARNLGICRTLPDRDALVCGWVHLRNAKCHGAGISIVEATSDGWWYTAPLANGRRVLAFHTDRDLPAARVAANGVGLCEAALRTTCHIGQTLKASGDLMPATTGFTAANGDFLERPVGDRWIAVGDAAFASDPIAGRGLLHALHTGIRAAHAVERVLDGDATGFNGYERELADLLLQYRRLRHYAYSQEKRFAASSFWRRRHVASHDYFSKDWTASPFNPSDAR